MREDEIPRAARGKCQSCKADIIWTVTEAGKDMPVDLAPGGYDTTAANIHLTAVGGEVKSRVVQPHLAFGNRTLHLAHWVRCPHSKIWRRRPAAATGTRKAPR